MKKKIRFKEFNKKVKELWAIPRYRAIIKLSLYGIMFLILIVMSNISNSMNINKVEQKDTNTYTEIINLLDLENGNINYDLKINNLMYKLEGKIENNIITGYFDNNAEIKKIVVKENKIYELKNNEELLNEELNLLIHSKLLIPTNIINIVKNQSAYIDKEVEESIYTFEVNEENIQYEVNIFINQEKITRFNIKNDEMEYNMLVDFDKNI